MNFQNETKGNQSDVKYKKNFLWRCDVIGKVPGNTRTGISIQNIHLLYPLFLNEKVYGQPKKCVSFQEACTALLSLLLLSQTSQIFEILAP